MSRAFTIVEGIDAAYGYVLRHTSLVPNEDLYQDIACEYIHMRKSGKSHGVSCTYILDHYTSTRSNKNNISYEFISMDDICDYTSDPFEDDLIERVAIENVNKILNSMLTRKQKIVFVGRIFDNRTLRDIATQLGLSAGRIHNIERRVFYRMRRCYKIQVAFCEECDPD